MNRQSGQFARRLLITSFLMAGAGAIIFGWFLPEHYLPVLPFLLLFAILLTLFTYDYLAKEAEKEPVKFTRANMVVTIIRLLAYSVVTILYFVISREKSVVFLIAIAVFYLVFTFLEVSDLSSLLRKKSKKGE